MLLGFLFFHSMLFFTYPNAQECSKHSLSLYSHAIITEIKKTHHLSFKCWSFFMAVILVVNCQSDLQISLQQNTKCRLLALFWLPRALFVCFYKWIEKGCNNRNRDRYSGPKKSRKNIRWSAAPHGQGRAIRIGYCIVFTILLSIGFTQYLLWLLFFPQYNTIQ